MTYALSPQLGKFQNWVNNIPEHDGIRPNENFARELMQLFTIGVNELNEDGTPKLDAAGQLVPTYGQADIETLARVLTGFTYPTHPGEDPGFLGQRAVLHRRHDPVRPVPRPGAQERCSTAACTSGRAAARWPRCARPCSVLVDHPNTPPFISRQLIQKTVTSSPTPGYVARVAAVFKDNGEGVRGDLAAVTRAILLDPEARGARKIDPEYGRLREPVLFWTAMIRGARCRRPTASRPVCMVGGSSQDLFRAPTVFNYYPADFTLARQRRPGTRVRHLHDRPNFSTARTRSTICSTTSTAVVSVDGRVGAARRSSRTQPARRARRSRHFFPMPATPTRWSSG